jgi:hypothetical protein
MGFCSLFPAKEEEEEEALGGKRAVCPDASR